MTPYSSMSIFIQNLHDTWTVFKTLWVHDLNKHIHQKHKQKWHPEGTILYQAGLLVHRRISCSFRHCRRCSSTISFNIYDTFLDGCPHRLSSTASLVNNCLRFPSTKLPIFMIATQNTVSLHRQMSRRSSPNPVRPSIFWLPEDRYSICIPIFQDVYSFDITTLRFLIIHCWASWNRQCRFLNPSNNPLLFKDRFWDDDDDDKQGFLRFGFHRGPFNQRLHQAL